MIKFFSKYIIPALLALPVLLTGCAGEDMPGSIATDGSKEGMFSLTLSSTRALSDGRPSESSEDPFNEFLIDNAYLFFYDGNTIDDTAEPIYWEHLTNLDATTQKSVTVNIPLNKLNKDNLTNFCVYAVANISDEEKAKIDALPAKTVAAIKEVVVGSQFDYALGTSFIQPKFVMDGTCETITAGSAKNSATGKVELIRSAAKITINISVKSQITVTENGKDVTYEPVTTDLVAYFCNGIAESKIDTDPIVEGFTPGKKYTSSNNVYFGQKTGDYPWSINKPFYSYPNSWKGSVTNDNRSFILLCVPWKQEGNTNEQRNYYYQVPVNYAKADGSNKDTADVLLRNNHYIVNVKVSKLGSEGMDVPDPVEEKDLDYMIMDWSTETIDVNLDKLRYLQVQRNEYVMNNTTDLSIPFVTSHDVEIVDACLNYKNYNIGNGTPKDYYVLTGKQEENKDKADSYVSDDIFSIITDGNNIKFHHNLNRIKTETKRIKVDSTWHKPFLWGEGYWEYTYEDREVTVEDPTQEAIGPFELTLTVRHKDQPSVLQKISVKQYPALYIEVQSSPSRNYVFVNGQRDSNADWNNIHNGNANNNNNNNYLINVTRFITDKYIIGDPREKSPISISGLSSHRYLNADNTVSTNVQTRNLQNYYQTNEDGTYKQYIAPILVVASSRGACQTMSKVDAKKRCASYQENGRPGGRWRLPTYGEVEFIMDLTNKGLIPRLFGNDGNNTTNYWIASGQVSVPNGGNTSGTVKESDSESDTYVRCVYDEWYWTDNKIPDANKDTFFWGDRKRSE